MVPRFARGQISWCSWKVYQPILRFHFSNRTNLTRGSNWVEGAGQWTVLHDFFLIDAYPTKIHRTNLMGWLLVVTNLRYQLQTLHQMIQHYRLTQNLCKRLILNQMILILSIWFVLHVVNIGIRFGTLPMYPLLVVISSESVKTNQNSVHNRCETK